jgi:hypothetical protein
MKTLIAITLMAAGSALAGTPEENITKMFPWLTQEVMAENQKRAEIAEKEPHGWVASAGGGSVMGGGVSLFRDHWEQQKLEWRIERLEGEALVSRMQAEEAERIAKIHADAEAMQRRIDESNARRDARLKEAADRFFQIK